MFQMYPKHITNVAVESYENLYHSRPIPVINSSIVPSNKAKTHMLKVLTFQEMFGNFPSALVVATNYNFKDPNLGNFAVHLHYF